MTRQPSLDELWNSGPNEVRRFQPDRLGGLPDVARRYLTHAITSGVPLASAVRLRMHGRIKLQGWFPFTAEQVICWQRGMIWRASVRMRGLPVRGFDRLVDGEGAMRWKLLGMIPVLKAEGPDVTRSAAGRLAAELVWLPSVLCGEASSWTAVSQSTLGVTVAVLKEPSELELRVANGGQLESVRLLRWGNPGGGNYQLHDFGAMVEEERTFGGYTVPSRLRVGWYLGSDRFESEGEFFRVTIDEAEYRPADTAVR